MHIICRFNIEGWELLFKFFNVSNEQTGFCAGENFQLCTSLLFSLHVQYATIYIVVDQDQFMICFLDKLNYKNISFANLSIEKDVLFWGNVIAFEGWKNPFKSCIIFYDFTFNFLYRLQKSRIVRQEFGNSTNALIIWMLTLTAVSLCTTDYRMAIPCLVWTYGRYRLRQCSKLEGTDWHLKFSIYISVN